MRLHAATQKDILRIVLFAEGYSVDYRFCRIGIILHILTCIILHNWYFISKLHAHICQTLQLYPQGLNLRRILGHHHTLQIHAKLYRLHRV